MVTSNITRTFKAINLRHVYIKKIERVVEVFCIKPVMIERLGRRIVRGGKNNTKKGNTNNRSGNL